MATLTSPSLEQLDHPYQPLLQAYRGALLTEQDPFSPTGLTRVDYLTMIKSVVDFFLRQQDERGAIIDSIYQRELHYSTPCFALGAALLANAGQPAYLEPAARALVHASQLLATGQAPDNHPDFFTIFLVKADELIRDLAAPALRDRWQANLRAIDPYQIYRFHSKRIAEEHIHNWNAINLTGEFLRAQAGLGGDADWWERYLPYHTRRFIPCGLYRDGDLSTNDHPLAYDVVTRYHLSAMMDAGYDGPHARQLFSLLLRGALTSLFLQSPVGEWPGAGRSAHHTWNDAALAATYEWAAHQLAASEPQLAAACKRGAHLAFQAMQPWLRPSGELNILRNHFEPEERHGFEVYSVHTTYNLWAAAALSVAYLLADDRINEAPLPSECMRYALDLGTDFHQIAAANHGFYLLIDACGDPSANPTGLVRVNRSGCNAQVGPSEGAVSAPRYSVLGPKGALAYAPAWKDRLGTWHSLAEYGASRGLLSPTWRSSSKEAGEAMLLEVTWRGALDGCRSIRAHYELSPDRMLIRYAVEGAISGLRAEIPLFAFDGQERADITLQDGQLQVRFRGSEVQVSAPSARLTLSDELVATRTGLLRKAWAETEGREIAIEVRLI